jgi:hypothetical protein
MDAFLPLKTNPCCGYQVDAHAWAEDLRGFSASTVMPKAGDMSVCLNCGGILVYLNESGDMRKAEFEEWQNLPSRDRASIRKIRRHILKRGRLH